MPPKYKLTYFQVTGRAEISRLMFAAAGVQYEDHRIKAGEWPTYKPSKYNTDNDVGLLSRCTVKRLLSKTVTKNRQNKDLNDKW